MIMLKVLNLKKLAVIFSEYAGWLHIVDSRVVRGYLNQSSSLTDKESFEEYHFLYIIRIKSLEILKRIVPQDVIEDLFMPAIADMQMEWYNVLRNGKRIRAKIILVKYVAVFSQMVVLYYLNAIKRRIFRAIRRTAG